MKWKEIKKKHPKAYKAFTISLGYTQENVIRARLILYNNRNLYDFFDKRGVYIRAKTPFEHVTSSTKTFLFGWFIQVPPNKSTRWNSKYMYEYYEETSMYDSREEAENTAFKKAFEILEEVIKKATK